MRISSLIVVSAHVIGICSFQARAEQVINAFGISKETNNSTVMYDARLTDDCRFVTSAPLQLHWSVPQKDGKIRQDGLNFIEKGLYGMDLKKVEPSILIGEVKAIQRRGLVIPVRITVAQKGRTCIVKTYLSGGGLPQEVLVTSLELKDFSGMAPKSLAVNGINIVTRRYESYLIDMG